MPGGFTASIFKMTPAGALTTLQTLSFSNATFSTNALVQGTDGNFYGTTTTGGTSSFGTIFR